MISEKKENHVLLRDEHDDPRGFAKFLTKIFDQFNNQNVVVDLKKYNDLSLEQLLCFLPLSNRHRSGKQSFVIVNEAVAIDRVPEEMMVVPTLGEAADVVEMEEIERDLGF